MTQNLFPESTIAQARENGLDLTAPDEPELVVLRRSELERYGDVDGCPMMARLLADGAVIDDSLAAASGQEVHDAYAEAVDEFVCAPQAYLKVAELADVVRGRLLRSRPDVQSDAVDAAWHSAWPVAEHLIGIGNPANILRYDGGEHHGRGGQLSVTLKSLGCIVTSEVDLLYTGQSKLTLHETDWKSGRTQWAVTSIARSFQFQMHAYLILENYPEVEAVEIQVATTRFGGWIHPVEFRREDYARYAARVYRAAEMAMLCRSLPIENVPCWPAAEKCLGCKVAARCRITPPESCAADPKAFVLSMHTLTCALAAMEDEAAEHVATHGEITCGSLAFGTNKPKSSRKPKSVLYLQGANDADD